PGGGLEGSETREQALVREVREECSCGVEIIEPFGEALEFLENRRGEPLEVHASFFRARFVGATAASWLAPEEARARVRRRCDAWAIAACAPKRTPALAGERFVDLSHAVHDGLVTYPGLPAPRIGEHLDRAASRTRYAPGTEFSIGRIELVA